MIKARLDVSQVTREYGAALRRLASLTGFDQRDILMGEAGIILKTWAGRTKVRKEKDIDRRTWREIFNKAGLDVSGGMGTKPGDITVNSGVRGPFGRVWVRTSGGKASRYGGKGKFRLAGVITPGGQNFRPMNYHWKDGTWADIQELTEDIAIQARKKIPANRRAAGLARQSVLQIADALGINLESVEGGGTLSAAGIAKARAAIASNGRAYNNGTGTILGTKEKTVVTLINNLPYGIPSGMDRSLLWVLNGRAKYFAKSYSHGAFDTMGKAARAYPWLRVFPPLNN